MSLQLILFILLLLGNSEFDWGKKGGRGRLSFPGPKTIRLGTPLTTTGGNLILGYYSQLRLQRHSAGHQTGVVIREVSLYPKPHYNDIVLQWDGTLLWAWKCCRYSRIVVISTVVISQVDCMCILLL